MNASSFDVVGRAGVPDSSLLAAKENKRGVARCQYHIKRLQAGDSRSVISVLQEFKEDIERPHLHMLLVALARYRYEQYMQAHELYYRELYRVLGIPVPTQPDELTVDELVFELEYDLHSDGAKLIGEILCEEYRNECRLRHQQVEDLLGDKLLSFFSHFPSQVTEQQLRDALKAPKMKDGQSLQRAVEYQYFEHHDCYQVLDVKIGRFVDDYKLLKSLFSPVVCANAEQARRELAVKTGVIVGQGISRLRRY
jgi:hypothetical protein